MNQLATLLARAQAVAAAVLPESITAEQVGALMADIVRLMDSTDQAASQVNTFVARIEAIEQQVQAQRQQHDTLERYVEQHLTPIDDHLRDIETSIETLQTTATQDRTAHEQRAQAIATRLATTESSLSQITTRYTTFENAFGEFLRKLNRELRWEYIGTFNTQTDATNTLNYDYVTGKRKTRVSFEVETATMLQTATVQTHYYHFPQHGVARGLQEMHLGENIYTRTFDIDPRGQGITYHAWKKLLLLNADTPLFVEATATGLNLGVNANNRLQDGHSGQGIHRRWVTLPIASSETAGIMTPHYVRKLHAADANATRALETISTHHTATTQALAQATEQGRQNHEVAMQSIASLNDNLTQRIDEAKGELQTKIDELAHLVEGNSNTLRTLYNTVSEAHHTANNAISSAGSANSEVFDLKEQVRRLTARIAALEARPSR